MSIVLKIKFNPLRGGASSYDFISPALRIDNWNLPVFSVLESSDDIAYSPLEQGVDWNADIDWSNNRLRLHILKDYDSIVYLALAGATTRNIPAAFDTESFKQKTIPASWNTGGFHTRLISSAYTIDGGIGKNIPCAFYEKFPNRANFTVAYGISGALKQLVNISFDIGQRHSINIPAAVWIMGVARLPSESLILPDDSDPAASRVRGRTKELTLDGTEWEELD